MTIEIKNCNNIDRGTVIIEERRLNIKYALNGTGKSTIARALDSAINPKPETLQNLKPFKFRATADNSPSVVGVTGSSIACFDEEYLQQYTFQQDELVKNSFEVFIKTPKYEEHQRAIEELFAAIKTVFRDNEDLDTLQGAMEKFIGGFKSTKTSFSTTGTFAKGLAKGNKIENIPHGLETYTPYLRHNKSAKWLKWQFDGKEYLDVANTCPYCTSDDVAEKKETIDKLGTEFEVKYIEYLNSMIDIFSKLSAYFSTETNANIKTLEQSADKLSAEQANFLFEVNKEIETLFKKLQELKTLGFHSFKDVDDVASELGKYKIDMNFFVHLRAEQTTEKVTRINDSIESLINQAGKLKGEINQQKILIAKNIQAYQSEINDFLKYAGYGYNVFIEDDKRGGYRLKLRHNDFDSAIPGGRYTLSFGERNAFALVLFMYDTLKTNPDLIILDDPISSFDGSKKFAILQMLFLQDRSFRNKTVLLLTHEFGTVIDTIYTPLRDKFHAKADFLQNNNGILTEIPIKKQNIKSVKQITETNIAALTENINKLVYLRRYLEIEGEKNMAWQLLSNLFHKRATPIIQNTETHNAENKDTPMSQEDVEKATQGITPYIPLFSYTVELSKINNTAKMIALYNQSRTGYEKLQIYRTIQIENSSNDVVKKFVNETFHIENDYLFQLNPCEYELIPQYIINECDKDLSQLVQPTRT
ncbi:AAA family ATPase [Treponema endosymbiont of Eucomonympha sp.]|uniref:AAA family ATPase n=1 Tax=Treponema endosymbiont of Eucomonympha sp. TaxID=1580831 RepID=UPI000782D4D0|nr:AAA family ATPase [Treponema endosymbiont of Eucomonympha sp.]